VLKQNMGLSYNTPPGTKQVAHAMFPCIKT